MKIISRFQMFIDARSQIRCDKYNMYVTLQPYHKRWIVAIATKLSMLTHVKTTRCIIHVQHLLRELGVLS